MNGRSTLLLPPSTLAGCLFAAIVRDTQGLVLNDEDRLNFFPASPLVCLTHVIQGELRMLPAGHSIDDFATAPALPATFVTPPQESPMMSWCAGPIFAVSVGIYPDAWARIGKKEAVLDMLGVAFRQGDDAQTGWDRFCAALDPDWRVVSDTPAWTASGRIAQWTRAMLARAALTGPGRSARSIERRVKRWTGQNNRTLDFFASFENLHRLAAQSRSRSLAELALEAGYTDQSHMGRAVKRGTGFSPARLNRLIATKEAFWCYRLLGEQF